MTNEEAIEFLKNMIDRESFIIPKGVGDFEKYHIEALQMSIKALSVDSVEVVRCKNCKYFHENVFGDEIGIGKPYDNLIVGHCGCEFWAEENDMKYTAPDAFCSYGERREANEQS